MNDLLTRLAASLTSVDSTDLLRSVGALQVIPENGDRLFRLEVLAHVASSLPSSLRSPASKGLSVNQLRRICNTAPIGGTGSVSQYEDPNEQLLTDNVTFYGGDYIIFPGIAIDSAFILRQLILAVFQLGDESFGQTEFRSRCHGVVSAALEISNAVARRAGLWRQTAAIPSQTDDVVVPPAAELERLKEAVTFTPDAIGRLLGHSGIRQEDLDLLILEAGTVDLPNFSPDSGELQSRPLVRCSDGTVIAVSPGLLPIAARHAVITLAGQYGVSASLADAYCAAIWNSVGTSLQLLGNALTQVFADGADARHADGGPKCVRGGFFDLDADKLLCALVVTDDFTDYDANNPSGQWKMDMVKKVVNESLDAAAQHLSSNGTGRTQVCLLLVLQGVGRWYVMGADDLVDGRDWEFLQLGAADLEVVSTVESGNGLALWKFARSYMHVRHKTQVVSMGGALDEFGFYRQQKYSYYADDQQRPTMLMIVGDFAASLRREAAEKVDRHAVLSCDRAHAFEVALLRGDRRLPIYAPLGGPEVTGRVAVVIEGMPVQIWVVGQPRTARPRKDHSDMYFQFAESVAYWLWQISPDLAPYLRAARLRTPNLIVELELTEGDNWDRIDEEGGAIAGAEPIETATNVAQGTIRLTFRDTIMPLCSTPTNSGERHIMAAVLRAIAGLLPDPSALSGDRIDEIIDERMPLGAKKMLLLLNLDNAFELDTRGLPKYRKIQDADIEEALDGLGERLGGEDALAVGIVPADERTRLINTRVVPYFYEEFRSLVSALNPAGLLEGLLERHEGVLREIAHLKLTAPTRVACFDFDTELPKRVIQELRDADTAALANRFLIEYVAAQPPMGDMPLSVATYDRLLALVWNIVQYGFTSDIIQYGLADIRLSMLTSGRLGKDTQSYDRAWGTFAPLFSSGVFASANRSFANHWASERTSRGANPTVNDGSGASFRQEDAALSAEFGLTLAEFRDLFGFLIRKALGGSSPYCCEPLEDLAAASKTELGWEAGKVNMALDLLSLRPRKDFLTPPAPYKGFDVWPWRFNRRLSYLRRPLLLRSRDGNEEVLWGLRHIYQASNYFLDQLLSGRLPAHGGKQSGAMSTYMGRLNGARGPEFESGVEKMLRDADRFKVARSVEKVGNLRLGVVGDIDILAADPSARVLYVLECKDISFAKTPYEMGQQINILYDPDLAQKSAVSQALRKEGWVRSNVDAVLDWFELPASSESQPWQVVSMVVTDEQMFTPHFMTTPIPIVAAGNLLERMAVRPISQKKRTPKARGRRM